MGEVSFARMHEMGELDPKIEVPVSWNQEAGYLEIGQPDNIRHTRGPDYTWRHYPGSRDQTDERLKGLVYLIDNQDHEMTAREIWQGAEIKPVGGGELTGFRVWLLGFQHNSRQLIGNWTSDGPLQEWVLFVDRYHRLVADDSLRQRALPPRLFNPDNYLTG